MKTSTLKFKTYINDTEENCFQIECNLSGKRPVYEDIMTRSGWFVEDFEISDLIMECVEGPMFGDKFQFKSPAFLPDAFRQRDIKEFEADAISFFVDDWIDCQNKAADNADFEYDLSCGN